MPRMPHSSFNLHSFALFRKLFRPNAPPTVIHHTEELNAEHMLATMLVNTLRELNTVRDIITQNRDNLTMEHLNTNDGQTVRVYRINVGNLNPEEVEAMVQRILGRPVSLKSNSKEVICGMFYPLDEKLDLNSIKPAPAEPSE